MRTARRRKRRRLVRLSRLVALVAVLVVVVVVLVTTLTGRMVVPGVSARVYPLHYQQEIATVADKYKVDPYLVAAVVRTESDFDPAARSRAGAVGLMQLLPTTAKWITGLDSWRGPENPALTNPEDNLELGACYLAYLFRALGNDMAALAAYNAGQGIVYKWVKAAGGADLFGPEDIQYPETREFVRRVGHYQTLYERVHPSAFARRES